MSRKQKFRSEIKTKDILRECARVHECTNAQKGQWERKIDCKNSHTLRGIGNNDGNYSSVCKQGTNIYSKASNWAKATYRPVRTGILKFVVRAATHIRSDGGHSKNAVLATTITNNVKYDKNDRNTTTIIRHRREKKKVS